MSKAEIIQELPRLKAEERREIFELICDMDERDLLNSSAPTAKERALLDQESEDYRLNPEAGSTWAEVEARLRKSSHS